MESWPQPLNSRGLIVDMHACHIGNITNSMSSRSHEPWSEADNAVLKNAFHSECDISKLAKLLGRSELAIRSRLGKLSLLRPLSEEQVRIHANTGVLNESKCLEETEAIAKTKKHQALSNEFSIDVQQAFKRFRFVYGLVNPLGQVYVGYSSDVWHRVAQHNRNLGAVATRGNGPWFPFAIYCFGAESDARSMETYIRANFTEFAMRSQTSIREVLAQIGVPITSKQLKLL